MVRIVVVSHSAKLAEGVVELAREMGGADVVIEPVGGLDLPGRPIGTDAVLVQAAIERAWSDDGVLVLMDLGSAVLSTEMALEMLPAERRGRVLLCEAPLVEGAVAAAVAARLGRPLEEVAEEARGGLAPKVAHLGVPEPQPLALEEVAEEPAGEEVRVRLLVDNPLGLHARPAARLVQTAGEFDAHVRVTNLTTGRGPASARSLNQVATLGVLRGHEIEVAARGPQAAEALAAIAALAARGFGDLPEAAVSTPAGALEAVPAGAIMGLAASPGVAVGLARRFRLPDIAVPDEGAGSPDAEETSLGRAIEAARREIRATRDSVAARAGEQAAAIFDAHLLFLEDDELLRPARSAIAAGRSAAVAWRDAVEEAAAAWRDLDDDYLRARVADLDAVGRQVLAHIVGAELGRPTLAGPGILLAPDLTPADTAGLDAELVLGVATALGGPTSHTAVLARSLGIPAVVGLGEAALSIEEGVKVILDGDAGTIRPDPTASEIERAKARGEAFRRTEDEARRSAHEPAETRDGVRITVFANASKPEDATAAVDAGADGIGLLRTEFLFLDRDRMPTEEEQAAVYRAIAEGLAGRPLILRTLDVGGDKPLPYVPMPVEANPFLGVRGIRLGLARPQLLDAQLRAVLRTAADHPVRVMFPMVATVEEFRAARAALDEAAREVIASGGRLPEHLEVGVMIEVPSAAVSAAALAVEAGFFSIGTNDLTQYTFAAERGNEAVAALSDALHPAILRLIRITVEAAEPLGRTVAVCGELAADPAAVPVLLGLGVRELSVSVPAVPRVKRAVREVDLAAARTLAAEALELGSAADVRALVTRRRSGC